MILRRVLATVLSHPLNRERKASALFGFVRWQISSRFRRQPVVHAFTGRSKLLVSKGLEGATGNLYCGLHEFEEMSFLLHFLRPEDLFLDIGANIGSYTILASAEIGAKSIALEPVPLTFAWLAANVSLNEIADRVDARNVAAGSEPGVIEFTQSLDSANHVATAGETDVVRVAVETLDNIVGVRSPTLMKIDVEGYETEVLRGARRTVANESLVAVIIELNGSGARYGFDDAAIHRDLAGLGFSPFTYEPRSRRLSPLASYGPHNTIYIRDHAKAADRVRSARHVSVRGAQV